MAAHEQPAAEFTAPQRRAMVDRARANLRAHSVVQHPRAYAVWEQYVAGILTRVQVLTILAEERRQRR
jgi:hypothetical protein